MDLADFLGRNNNKLIELFENVLSDTRDFNKDPKEVNFHT